MDLDELDEILAAKAPERALTLVPPLRLPGEVAKPKPTGGTRSYGLRCRKCQSVWQALYHGDCLVCRANRLQVEIQWTSYNYDEPDKDELPDETVALKNDLPEAITKDGMGVIEYLRAMRVASGPELIGLKRNHPEEFNTLIVLAKEEMRAKGIKITGRYGG